jgi:hypothetical protein
MHTMGKLEYLKEINKSFGRSTHKREDNIVLRTFLKK